MNQKPNDYYYYKYQKYKSKYHELSCVITQSRIQNDAKHELDIKEILNIAVNCQILGMAEATHGQNEITKFRIKIFKLLVKKCGYTVFVLEDQYSCCEQINQYIQFGINHPRNLLMDLMWFWQSFEMLGLIKWMRKYNLKWGNILEFKGLDIQSICNNPNKKDLIATYVKNKNRANNRVDQDDWVVADGFRDKSMFGVFMKIYDPAKKYFLYAHNYHIAKQDLVGMLSANTNFEGRYIRAGETVDWLGCRLSKKFHNKYFAIGNVFTSGSYLETFDLVEQNRQSGIKTIYHKYENSDMYITVNNIPTVGKIDSDNLPEGLTILNSSNREFDAVMKIAHETPLDIISLDTLY